jgi:hypothetical protein
MQISKLFTTIPNSIINCFEANAKGPEDAY